MTNYKSGEVTLKCRVSAIGTPADRSVHSETPAGFGFGKAAMKLRSRILLFQPEAGQGPWVLIPFRWDGDPAHGVYIG